ncbi:MAG TPA: DivIVA domain-containing protein [Acidimicrobiales bacterium]|nr:DivIVA domain-containing protein [Acidimicrobiales bacterium]
MESKTNAPSFTVSLRGYDRMEVDEYLDSLAEALGQVEEAEERSRGLQAHIERLNVRIAELEDRIRADVPKTGGILAERISIMLRTAEETAADTINRAEAASAEMLEKAHEDVASAEDRARGAIARGEEQARRLEAAARAEAAEIVAEAEGRASTRTRQIEQWAEQVISHTRAEEARMLAEQQDKREQCEAELQALTEQRDAVAASIAQLREALGQALGLVGTGKAAALKAGLQTDGPGGAEAAVLAIMTAGGALAPESGEGENAGEVGGGQGEPHGSATDAPSTAEAAGLGGSVGTAETADATGKEGGDPAEDDEMPWPAAFRPLDEASDERDDEPNGPGTTADADRTGEIELRDLIGSSAPGEATVAGETGQEEAETTDADEEADDFETKLEAWVAGSAGPRHFRRL